MIRRRIRWLSAIVVAAAVSTSALAQQGGTPINRGPQTQPPQTIVPGANTKTPPGPVQSTTPGATWEAFAADARARSAQLHCQGPLPLEIQAINPRDASKGTRFLLSFKEASGPTDIKTGECWRSGSFTFGTGSLAGSLNGGQKKGDISYSVVMPKCPAIASLKFEGGKVTGTFNEVYISEKMINAATTPGRFIFETKWLHFNDATGQARGWGHYEAVLGDLSPFIPACR